MKKDQVVILEKRGTLLITGDDAKDFLQNIITNDINKVTPKNSIFSALLTPQGKYLNEFFIIKNSTGYLLDCGENSAKELLKNLSKYKLRSKVDIKDLSSEYVVGVISHKKYQDLQKELGSTDNTINYRNTPIFSDLRNKQLGARIFSSLEKLYLTIKKLNLKIIDSDEYYSLAYKLGIPETGLHNLKDRIFGLEANFEKLQAIDFKKGCFIGQENTARMKLKNKVRRKLLPIVSKDELKIGDELIFNKSVIGKILIDRPYPFALIKLFDPDFSKFRYEDIDANSSKVKIINIP